MKESLTQLSTEALTIEREWTVEEIPVLTAAVSLPEPVPAPICGSRPPTYSTRAPTAR